MSRKNRVLISFLVVALLGFSLLRLYLIVQAAVTLVSFEAFPGNQQVVLEWETASESEMLGFYITRNNQLTGNYTRLNSDFIFTQGSDLVGLIYQYIDSNVTNGQTYYYKLEAVDINYDSEFFGPISAIPRLPTVASVVVPSQTINLTYSPTVTRTPTMTVTPSPNLTHTRTSTFTSTSPFSFITNTPTETATKTPLDFVTMTPTPDLTGSATVLPTRTFEIIVVNNPTPTMVVEPESTKPFTLGLIGFGVALVIGTLLITLLLFIQRKRTLD